MELQDVHVLWHRIASVCWLLALLQRKTAAGLAAIGERVWVCELRVGESSLAEMERRGMGGVVLRVILEDDPLLRGMLVVERCSFLNQRQGDSIRRV